MADRKAQLAEKRKKLEELRSKNQQRQGQPIPASPLRTARPGSPVAPMKEIDVNDLVSSLIGEKTPVKTKENPPSQAVSSARRLGGRFGKRNLKISEPRNICSIAPHETVFYSKSVQTEMAVEVLVDVKSIAPGSTSRGDGPGILDATIQNKDAKEDAIASVPSEPEEVKIPELSKDEIRRIFDTPDFIDFFDRSTRIVERALCQKYDVTVDYGLKDADTADDGANIENVSFKSSFFDATWSKGRSVTCMDWSPKFPELLAVGYNADPDHPESPDGVVLVWNIHLPNRPEFIFECQSAVLSVCFSPYSPNLIIGATYSGQVVLWDNRSKRTAVQRSAVRKESHTHPVFCTAVLGTQNAHNLVTVSTDGKMCSWNLDMLNTPQETLELKDSTVQKPIAVTCFAFPSGDINNFVVGSEEGMLYPSIRHGAKAGQDLKCFNDTTGDVTEQRSHHGPVTAVDFHKAQGSGDFAHLFLSSSTDWTVKLWSYRNTSRPLYSFEEAGDYIYDVAWSPTHPALFVTADGMGCLDFWNLNQDTEIPAAKVWVDKKEALNCVKWGANGRTLAVGDAAGVVHIYEVGERLSTPRLDESIRLKETIAIMQETKDGEMI